MTKRVLAIVVVIIIGASLFVWWNDQQKRNAVDMRDLGQHVVIAQQYADTLVDDAMAALGETGYRVTDTAANLQLSSMNSCQVIYTVERADGTAFRYRFVVEVQDGGVSLYSEGILQ